ncbi:hypothetical protein ABPG72_016673 [Tetrahymena utriculariae]
MYSQKPPKEWCEFCEKILPFRHKCIKCTTCKQKHPSSFDPNSKYFDSCSYFCSYCCKSGHNSSNYRVKLKVPRCTKCFQQGHKIEDYGHSTADCKQKLFCEYCDKKGHEKYSCKTKCPYCKDAGHHRADCSRYCINCRKGGHNIFNYRQIVKFAAYNAILKCITIHIAIIATKLVIKVLIANQIQFSNIVVNEDTMLPSNPHNFFRMLDYFFFFQQVYNIVWSSSEKSSTLGEENISDEECKQINEVAKYYKEDLHFLGLQLWQNSIKLSQICIILKDIRMMNKLDNLQIDIRQNKIGKNGVESLTNFIKLQKNLKTLGLSLNKNLIGEQGAQMIGYCLQDLPQLESLEIFLTDNVVGQDGFSILMSGVENLEKLNRFIMRAQNCRIKDVGANSMFYILSKKNILKELIINLDANSLTNAIVEDFQQMMNNLQNNLNVFELSVCQNGLTTEGIKSIMEYSIKPQNLQRLRLFLCFNINTSPQFFPKELGLLTKLKILSLGFEQQYKIQQYIQLSFISQFRDMLIGDIQAKEIFGAISQLENLHTMIVHLGYQQKILFSFQKIIWFKFRQNVISQKSYTDFQKMILQLQYLTLFYIEFRDNNIMIRKHELNKIKKYVYDKYANVLSSIAYEKYIKQQLLYKSDFSHWDLSMG